MYKNLKKSKHLKLILNEMECDAFYEQKRCRIEPPRLAFSKAGQQFAVNTEVSVLQAGRAGIVLMRIHNNLKFMRRRAAVDGSRQLMIIAT